MHWCIKYEYDEEPYCYYVDHGSGFIVGENVVATNWHVAEYFFEPLDLHNLPSSISFPKLYVKYPAEQTLNDNEFLKEPVEVTGVYSGLKYYNIALLQVNTLGRKPVKLNSQRWEDAEILSPVMAMGYPLNFEFVSATTGRITSILINANADNNIWWIKPETKLYKVDVQIDAGDSGGPLFNKEGEVIGINFSAKRYYSNPILPSLALASDYLKKIDLTNLEFETRSFPNPEDYQSSTLFDLEGEVKRGEEKKLLATFIGKRGHFYKVVAKGVNHEQIPPASTVLILELEFPFFSFYSITLPDYENYLETHIYWQWPDGWPDNLPVLVYIQMAENYQPPEDQSGWYEVSGYDFYLPE